MERLMALVLAVEFDLQGEALDFLSASRLKVPEAVDRAIADAAPLDAAWRELLAEMGIPWPDMREAGPRPGCNAGWSW
jgi:hypothetical protein